MGKFEGRLDLWALEMKCHNQLEFLTVKMSVSLKVTSRQNLLKTTLGSTIALPKGSASHIVSNNSK